MSSPVDPTNWVCPLPLRETTRIVMSFEVVQLLENDGGNDDVVVFESLDTVGRVKDDVGIKDQIFH